MDARTSSRTAPIRVALVVSSEFSGGGEQYLYRLYDRLVREGRVSVDLIGSLPQWSEQIGPKIEVGRSPKLTRRRGLVQQFWGLVLPMFRSWRTVRRKQYDIVHVQYFKEKLALPVFLRRVPIIWTEHGPLPENFPPGGLRLLAWQARYTTVIAVSKGVAASLKKQGITSRVIPNPLPALGGTGTGVSLNTCPTPTKLLFAGRLHRSKRIELLIEAAKINPDLHVMIAGDGPDRKYYEALSPENVHFLGLIDPILPLIASSTAVVVTSGTAAREGSPMVMLEARQLGVPVFVAADCHAAEEARELGCAIFEPTGEALAAAAGTHTNLVRSELPERVKDQRSETSWATEHYQLMNDILKDIKR